MKGQWKSKGVDKYTAVVGKKEKREVTVLLTVAATECLLPPQVLYQGKTPGCHPKVTFPVPWNITYNESHRSNKETIVEYVDRVLFSYVLHMRQ